MDKIKKPIIIISAIFLIFMSCDDKNEMLYIVHAKSGTGIISNKGKIVLPLEYYWGNSLNKTYFIMQQETITDSTKCIVRFLYNRKNGELKIFPFVPLGPANQSYYQTKLLAFLKDMSEYYKYDSAFIFDENLNQLAAIKTEYIKALNFNAYIFHLNGKQGVVNTKGQILLHPIYDYIYAFNNIYLLDDSEFGDGYFYNQILKNDKIELFFNKDLIIAGIDNKFGVYDSVGKLLNPVEYDHIWDYNNGILIVENDGKYALIKPDGKKMTDYYESIGDFSDYIENKEIFSKTNKNPYDYSLTYSPFIRRLIVSDKLLIEYKNIKKLSTNLIKVKNDGLYGYIDFSGKVAIPMKYDAALNFSNGLAAVKQNGSWGYIDTINKVVVDFKYDSLSSISFNSGFFLVNGKWGMINRQGKIIEKAEYKLVSHYPDNISILKKDEKYYFFKHDSIFKNFAVDNISDIDHGRIWFERNGKWGMIDTNIVIMENAKYKCKGINIRYLGGKYFTIVVSENNKYGLLDAKGKMVLQPIYTKWPQPLSDCYFMIETPDSLFKIINSKGYNVCGEEFSSLDVDNSYEINLIPAITKDKKYKRYYTPDMELIYSEKLK